MITLLRHVSAPIFSLALYILGSGFFNTYVAVRMDLESVSTTLIGIVGASFAIGLVVGSRYCDQWIARVGHIRAFAAFASTTAACILIQALFIHPWAWIPLRFLTGICAGGLYIVVESWLLASSTPANRGRILAVYMSSFYLAQSAGQLFLNLGDPKSITLFIIPALLCSLAVWPVSMTRSPSPTNPEAHFFKLTKLFRESPVGIAACFMGGLVLGSFYNLTPIFIQDAGLSLSQVSYSMALTVFGGLALQLPIGALSDRIDRRIVIAVLGVATAACSLAMITVAGVSTAGLMATSILFGGFAFTIYPMGITHACDRVEDHKMVSATASLLLTFGIGSIVGPLVAPAFMAAFGPAGLMYFMAGSTLLLSGFTLVRMTRRASVPEDEKTEYTPVPPRASPIAGELTEPTDESEEPEAALAAVVVDDPQT